MQSPNAHGRRLALATAALLLASLVAPPAHAGPAAPQKLKVDIQVTVHNSEVGVSQETLDDLVEKLLEEAGFQVEENAADSATIELKIDVYKEDNGRFKVVGDLDDPRDGEEEDEEEHEERTAEAQEQIDDLVTAIVNDFIRVLRNP